MPLICYQPKRFAAKTLYLIGEAVAAIDELVGQGYDLTVRQLYYLMIARDKFPDTWIDREYNLKHGLDPDTKNTMKNYKKFCGVVSDARRAGLIDWSAIVDRGRALQSWAFYRNPAHRMRSAANSYAIDLWKDQPRRVEVWVEKDALLGVLERVCSEYGVPYTSCKGYTSDSEIWAAAQRLREYRKNGQEPVVLQLSDHDSSGIDMERDISDRLYLFAREDIEVHRVAFTWDQVQEFNPPPNPAKETDPRFKQYQEKYGDDSWELDAIAPPDLHRIIGTAIESFRDDDLWTAAVRRQEKEREQLTLVADHFPQAVRLLTKAS